MGNTGFCPNRVWYAAEISSNSFMLSSVSKPCHRAAATQSSRSLRLELEVLRHAGAPTGESLVSHSVPCFVEEILAQHEVHSTLDEFSLPTFISSSCRGTEI